MDNEGYKNLVVRAELMAPVIFDRWQPLDGILASAIIEDPEYRERSRHRRNYRRMLKRHGKEKTHRIFKEKGWKIPSDDGHFLPLAVWGHGQEHGLWVYCSSWAIPAEYEYDLVHFTRRINFEQVNRYVKPQHKRIYTAKKEFASKYLPFQTIITDSLIWYVQGIKEEIEGILTVIGSIGKKRRRGYGRVRGWTVEEEGEDRSVFTSDGELMRPVPAELLGLMGLQGEFEYAFTTYRPPYWDGRYAARCAVKGQLMD